MKIAFLSGLVLIDGNADCLHMLMLLYIVMMFIHYFRHNLGIFLLSFRGMLYVLYF